MIKTSQSPKAAEMQKQLYNWFVFSIGERTEDKEFMLDLNVDIYQEWLKIPKKDADLIKVTNQAGMCAFLRAWFYH
jgi:hypothetical protein